MTQQDIPSVKEILDQMARAGTRLNEINACEANAGNMSVCIPTTDEVAAVFPNTEPYELPVPAPALAGRTVLITGSQQRLRDIALAPTAVVGAIEIGPDNKATLRSAPNRAFERPTSEANSHIAVHNDQIGRRGLTGVHAVVHAHPKNITALSYGEPVDSKEFFRNIMRWEPEIVVHVPDGVGFLPFEVPGSKALQEASVAGLRNSRIVVWAKHGVFARSDKGPLYAVDVIEFIETGAQHQIRAQQLGQTNTGLTDDELRSVVKTFGIKTDAI